MRIIAGSLGGRSFDSPHGHRTHPMSDKIRGALFNALGDIEGLTVLDAFAGSGALSFEAISRGAASSIALDIDKLAITTVVKNVADLNLQGRIKPIKASLVAWLSTSDDVFDIVLADPPYNEVRPTELSSLAERAKADGVIVFSLPPAVDLTLGDTYQLLITKLYGDAKLVFYRRLA